MCLFQLFSNFYDKPCLDMKKKNCDFLVRVLIVLVTWNLFQFLVHLHHSLAHSLAQYIFIKQCLLCSFNSWYNIIQPYKRYKLYFFHFQLLPCSCNKYTRRAKNYYLSDNSWVRIIEKKQTNILISSALFSPQLTMGVSLFWHIFVSQVNAF